MKSAAYQVCPETLKSGQSTSASPTQASKHNKALIAVIDDDDDVRAVLQTILEEEYRVEAFATASDLLTFLKDTRCDLIISDLEMPFHDGFALIAALKQDRVLSNIPVAAFTADSSAETRKRAFTAGFCSYLVKPADLGNVLKTAHLLIPDIRIPEADRAGNPAMDG